MNSDNYYDQLRDAEKSTSEEPVPDPKLGLYRELGEKHDLGDDIVSWEQFVFGLTGKTAQVLEVQEKLQDWSHLKGVNFKDLRDIAENCIYITDKKTNLSLLKYNNVQNIIYDIYLEEMANHGKVRLIILKIRQTGVSTLFDQGIFLPKVITNPFYNAAIISYDDESTNNLYSRLRFSYGMLPLPMRPMEKVNRRRELLFENPDSGNVLENLGLQSKVLTFTAGAKYLGSSYTLNAVHISELAKIDNAEEHLSNLSPAIPNEPGSIVVYEFTAYGMGFAHDFWQDSAKGNTGFRPVFIGLLDFPEYQLPLDSGNKYSNYKKWDDKLHDDEEKWLVDEMGATPEQIYYRREVLLRDTFKGNLNKLHQNYPVIPEEAFISTGNFVFPIDGLKRQKENILEPIRGELTVISLKDKRFNFERTDFGQFRLFEEPKLGFCYGIGVDVAEGHEIRDRDYDYSVISILRRGITDGVLSELNIRELNESEYIGNIHVPHFVGHWRGNLPTHKLAELSANVGWWFNYAWMNIERNNAGNGVVDPLMEVYKHLLLERKYSKTGVRITSNVGARTTLSSKPVIIGHYVEAVTEGKVRQPNEESIGEYGTYVNKEGKMNAEQGKHDDYVIADALAWDCHLYAPMSRPGNMPGRPKLKRKGYRSMFEVTGY